jgi:hypothetical protein
MQRVVKHGHVPGGRCFGYNNVDVLAEPDADGRRKRLHVRREIDTAEAAVVREIFDLCARGIGKIAIAKYLNDKRAPTPRSQQGRPLAWAPSSVRAVLYREIYRGQIVWNKTCWVDEAGDRRPHQRRRPESEWVPSVMIALFRSAQARFSRGRRSL